MGAWVIGLCLDAESIFGPCEVHLAENAYLLGLFYDAMSSFADDTEEDIADSKSARMDCDKIFREAEDRAIDSGRVLVMTNISKFPNMVQLILLAEAHNMVTVIVGMMKTQTEDLINIGLKFFRLEDIPTLNMWLKRHKIFLLGIEIMDSARSVHENPFSARMALMPGNEGTGLSLQQKSICDGFVIIPQYGTATASLNVHVATCLVLYRFSRWAAS